MELPLLSNGLQYYFTIVQLVRFLCRVSYLVIVVYTPSRREVDGVKMEYMSTSERNL